MIYVTRDINEINLMHSSGISLAEATDTFNLGI